MTRITAISKLEPVYFYGLRKTFYGLFRKLIHTLISFAKQAVLYQGLMRLTVSLALAMSVVPPIKTMTKMAEAIMVTVIVEGSKRKYTF